MGIVGQKSYKSDKSKYTGEKDRGEKRTSFPLSLAIFFHPCSGRRKDREKERRGWRTYTEHVPRSRDIVTCFWAQSFKLYRRRVLHAPGMGGYTHTHTLFLRLFSLRLLIPTIRSNTLERSFFFPYVGDGNKPLERPRSRRHVRRLRNKELGLNRAFLFLSFLRRKVYRNFDLDFY